MIAWSKLKDSALRPIDGASLVLFRIVFGAVILWEVWRYMTRGWIHGQFIRPELHFSYFGLDWLQPWPGVGMYVHFYAVGFLALLVGLGAFYRLSATLLWLALSYIFLLDQAQYLNHFYLVCLISFLMILVPANRALSVDAMVRGKARSDTIPAWALWMLRGQFAIVYVYGGIAKINGDWLRGYPLRDWISDETNLPFIGPFMDEPWMAVAFSWSGMLFDLLVVPALLWKPTRWFAVVAAVCFHVLNSEMFSIGIFPWFALAATTLYLPPSWPRRIFNWPRSSAVQEDAHRLPQLGVVGRAAAALLIVFFVVQLTLPLRHWLYPGDVNWTEEGHRFSWRMKLRDKQSVALFTVTDVDTGESQLIDTEDYLTGRQYRKMAAWPSLIHQFARHLADEARADGRNIEVRAEVYTSLNGRARQFLVDPEVDLAAEPSRFISRTPWIVPLSATPPWQDSDTKAER